MLLLLVHKMHQWNSPVTIANGVTLTVQSGGKVCSSMSTIVATNIQTDTIKHSGGTTAMTIASSGVVTPKTTSFVSVSDQAIWIYK